MNEHKHLHPAPPPHPRQAAEVKGPHLVKNYKKLPMEVINNGGTLAITFKAQSLP